ncbi:phosphoserine phosphatase SerB [uncultured Paraglaciecola sp.]|uniref:phosphoserine phosphatase SerB n=1 Tax=uncultured Paraglaciecola sp. TaxID=1765024 RepID=UPI0025937E0D|nr:phosphoserine phosphatase SerB [uncultured Paraglaciecola sp.]
MFELKVSKSHFLSHIFLKELIDEHGLKSFTLADDAIFSVEPISGGAHSDKFLPESDDNKVFEKLLIFCEGLHLQQLHLISLALHDYLEAAIYNVVRVDGVSGFAMCAQVKVVQSQGIKAQIEKVANQLSVELCWFNQVPTLTQPGLLLMDMDSTVIAVECIDEIAELAGVGTEVSEVTARAMKGELDFAQSLRTRVSCLQGADEAILQQVRDALPLMPGVANLVELLKKYNWKVAIASGGFTYFADYLAQRLALDAAVANGLDIVDGKLTGNLVGRIIDAEVKAETLDTLAKKWDIPVTQTIAMGDGANDLVMMNAAALGVGLHAKPVVREKADMAIRRGGLDTLLWVLAAN